MWPCAVFRIVEAILLSLFLLPAVARAEEGQNAQLAAIEAEVSREMTELERIRAERRELERTLTGQRERLQQLRREESELVDELQRIEGDRRTAEENAQRLEREIERLRLLSAARVRALYFRHSGSELERLVLYSKTTDIGRNAFYAAKVKSYDTKRAADFGALLQQQQKRKEELARLEADHRIMRSAVEERRRQIEGVVNARERTVRELSQKEAAGEKHLVGLRAQALRLETVISSLTSPPGDQPAEKGEVKPGPKPVPSSPAGPFDGPGLFRLKGSLALPVQGAVLRPYGRQRHEQFEDFVFHKGIEFAADSDSNVVAIAPGRVLHRGRMPAYGTIVILDHGKRYYSLYGRLATTRVERGQTLERGETIGTVAASDERGKSFYFEIRRNGQPVNPQLYYNVKLNGKSNG